VGTAIHDKDLRKWLSWDKVPQKVLDPATAHWVQDKYAGSGWSNHELANPSSASSSASSPGDGAGWTARCDIDMYMYWEVTPEEIYQRYVMMNRPVLLRRLNENSTAWDAYHKTEITRRFGSERVHVSDIPYNVKFGSQNGEDLLLAEYLDEVNQGRVSGGKHPWYVFKGNPVPLAAKNTSIVAPSVVQTPDFMYEVFRHNRNSGRRFPDDGAHDTPSSPEIQRELDRREPFVNLQWALGVAGSGAPVHFHNTAWNSLFYGRKHWYIYPPSRNLMGKKQTLLWVEEDLEDLKAQGYLPYECTQEPGDVLIVPELWGHAVLNVRDSVAVATEVAGSNFRPAKLPRAFGDVSGTRKGGGGRRKPEGRPRPPR